MKTQSAGDDPPSLCCCQRFHFCWEIGLVVKLEKTQTPAELVNFWAKNLNLVMEWSEMPNRVSTEEPKSPYLNFRRPENAPIPARQHQFLIENLCSFGTYCSMRPLQYRTNSEPSVRLAWWIFTKIALRVRKKLKKCKKRRSVGRKRTNGKYLKASVFFRIIIRKFPDNYLGVRRFPGNFRVFSGKLTKSSL